MFSHVIDKIFKLGKIGGLINKDIAICIPWATPEALGILSVDGGEMISFLFVIVVVAHKFMGL